MLIACSDNKEELLEDINTLKNETDITTMLELSMAKMQEEIKYLNLSNKKVELYQKMLSYIIFTNRLKENKIDESIKIKQSYLWRFGISGDNPIILAKINNMQDLYVIDQLMEAYKYFTIKNIDVDLVIVHAEENIYEQ